jgi:hypothetical protein
MIRVKCPNCELKLSLEDSKAGGVGSCPDCGQRFRIPNAGAEAAPKPRENPARRTPPQERPTRAAEAAARPAPQPPRRPGDSWMYEDSSPYAVKDEPDPEPPKELRRVSEDPDDDLDPATYSFDKDYARQRKKRLREQQLEERRRAVSFIFVMVLIWIAAGLFAFFQRDWAIGPYGVGALACLIGGIWLIVQAFKENIGAGFLMLFLPFYDWYFGILHFGQAGPALMLKYVGLFIMGTALLINPALFKPVIEQLTPH